MHLYLSEIWNLSGNPFASDRPEACLQSIPRGALAVDEHGRVAAIGDAAEIRRAYPGAAETDFGDAILLPGFVDTHLHFPQLDIIGSYGEDLVGWLERYTFPAEAAFADPAHAKNAAGRFVSELFAHGTTTAAIFSSTHRAAAEALFEESLARGLRAFVGKVSMDRNAPAAILQGAESDLADCEALFSRWHGRDARLFCAITPRFAPTSSEAQLEAMRELRRRHPDALLQTHYSESSREIDWVKLLFPNDADYLAVYDRFGLLGPRTILGHAIHASPRELARIAEAGARVAHCPTSNLFLGSGLFPLREYAARKIPVGLGTDIGGGTSLSLWATMAEAYKIQALLGHKIGPAHLLWLATRGGAEALGLPNAGHLSLGAEADFQVLDPSRHRLLAERFRRGGSPAERLFALATLADDRLVREVYIRGRRVYNAPRIE